MIIEIDQSVLLSAFSSVMGAVMKNASVGILSAIKFSCNSQSKTITLEATNLDIRITSNAICNSISQDIEFCVVADRFFEIVKKLKSGSQVRLEYSGDCLKLSSGKSKFSVQCLDVEDYPKRQDSEIDFSKIKIDVKKLISLIDKVKFCIYQNETRFNLNGIYFHKKDDENSLCTVATDGHRLAYAHCEVEEGSAETFKPIIIPRKSILELRKILDSSQNEIAEILISPKQAVLKTTSYEFSTKLIDAEFPDYKKVVPQSNTNIISVEAKELIEAINRVSAIYNIASEVSISIKFCQDKIFLSTKKNDLDLAEDEIEAKAEFSEEIIVSYNYTYLRDICQNILSKNAKFYLLDSKTPAIIKDDILETYFYILMPMRS